MTEQLFKALTEDEIAYERNERKLKYELDHNTELAHAKKEGREEGLQEGRDEGVQEGREEGLQEGETLHLIKLVCKKLAKNKSAQQIASELEEDLSCIQRIAAAAEDCAPGCDTSEIYEKLKALPKE